MFLHNAWHSLALTSAEIFTCRCCCSAFNTLGVSLPVFRNIIPKLTQVGANGLEEFLRTKWNGLEEKPKLDLMYLLKALRAWGCTVNCKEIIGNS